MKARQPKPHNNKPGRPIHTTTNQAAQSTQQQTRPPNPHNNKPGRPNPTNNNFAFLNQEFESKQTTHTQQTTPQNNFALFD
jgi:hypothetical protein